MSAFQAIHTLREEILDKFGKLITAAFGLVAALAWNDAIKAIFKEIFGKPDAIQPMLIYATLVTVIAVLLVLLVSRAVVEAKGKKKELEEDELVPSAKTLTAADSIPKDDKAKPDVKDESESKN